MKEIRANFLVLAVILVILGGAAARYEGIFDVPLFFVTVAGVVLAHISVNLFNEYSDWKTGIDEYTERTPFSGGSENLQAGLLPPEQVRTAAWMTLFAAFLIGIWLMFQSGWPVLVLMGIGGFSAVFYTDYLAKWLIGELMSGLSLGSLVVIGAYFVQTGSISSTILWASIPPGILTALLLFLNEFPDAEADRKGGRRHMVIAFGYRRAGVVYAVSVAGMYAVLGAGVFLGELPMPVLAGLLTVPLGCAAAYRALRYYDNIPKLLPALGMNVLLVLATDFLMAVGFILA